MDERTRLRGLLWFAWNEMNAIRARSGAPLAHDGMTTCAEEYWSDLVNAMAAELGEDDLKPWPSSAATAISQALFGTIKP